MNGELKQQLSRFIIDELTKGDVSETDPKPLLAYIMALICQDKPQDELKSYCVAQLSEFLGNSTADFVSKLFTRMEQLKRKTEGSEDTSDRRSDRSRKRRIGDEEDDLNDNEEERAFKRKRKDSDTSTELTLGDIMYESGRRRSDRTRRDSYHHSDRDNWDDRRPKRGYEDSDHVELSRLPPQHPGYPSMQAPMRQMPIGVGPHHIPNMIAPFPQIPMMPNPNDAMFLRGGGRGNRGRGRGRDQRHVNGSDSKKKLRNTCTLDIAGIPKELNTLPNLVTHFDKFGTIVNIQVGPENDRATVQYSTSFEAKKAISSPEAVLGNRFIKVYWAKDKEETGTRSEKINTEEKAMAPPPKPRTTTDTPSPKPTKTAPQLNTNPRTLSLSNKKQDVRKSSELKKKRDEILAELMSKQDEILSVLTQFKDKIDDITQTALKTQLKEINSQITEIVQKKEKEIAKTPLASESSLTVHNEQQVNKELSEEQKSQLPENPENVSKVRQEKLMKTLDELRRETAARGIDTSQFTHSRGRGGFRGRGSRGRGGYIPSAHRALDNRTTTLSASVPPTITSEELKTHLQTYGKIDHFELQDGVVTVTYSNRREAESAFKGGQKFKSVDLTFNWVKKSVESNQLEQAKEAADLGHEAIEEVHIDHEDEEESFHYFDAEEEEDWKR